VLLPPGLAAPFPDGLPHLLSDLELDRLSGLPLHDDGQRLDPPAQRHVLRPQGDEIAAQAVFARAGECFERRM
jgi:hypothetical protein